MYRPNELFAKLPPAIVQQIFDFLHEKQRPLYHATLDAICKQRKLRPIFIDRKPKPERFAYLADALGRKQNEGIAAQLLQIWFVGTQSKLLCDFLDALGIKHDENGSFEELPPAPSKDALRAAVDAIIPKHDPAVVAGYLHAFQALDDKGWPTLDELLAEDERLKL
jgi:hypothetical protein